MSGVRQLVGCDRHELGLQAAHLFGCFDAILQLDTVGDVARVDDDRAHGWVVAEVGHVRFEDAYLTEGAHDSVLDQHTFAGRRSRGEPGAQPGEVGLQRVVQDAGAEHRLGRSIHDPDDRFSDVTHLEVVVELPDYIGAVLHQRAEALLAGGQGLVRRAEFAGLLTEQVALPSDLERAALHQRHQDQVGREQPADQPPRHISLHLCEVGSRRRVVLVDLQHTGDFV